MANDEINMDDDNVDLAERAVQRLRMDADEMEGYHGEEVDDDDSKHMEMLSKLNTKFNERLRYQTVGTISNSQSKIMQIAASADDSNLEEGGEHEVRFREPEHPSYMRRQSFSRSHQSKPSKSRSRSYSRSRSDKRKRVSDRKATINAK